MFVCFGHGAPLFPLDRIGKALCPPSGPVNIFLRPKSPRLGFARFALKLGVRLPLDQNIMQGRWHYRLLQFFFCTRPTGSFLPRGPVLKYMFLIFSRDRQNGVSAKIRSHRRVSIALDAEFFGRRAVMVFGKIRSARKINFWRIRGMASPRLIVKNDCRQRSAAMS
jgi:hypothetical protein